MAKKSRPRSTAGQPAADGNPGQERQPRFMMLALEQRFMFDGAAVATAAADVSSGSGETGWHDTGKDVAPDSPTIEPVPPAMQAAPRDRTEIVFVDKRVPDYQALIDAVNPGAEIIFLDGDQDGVAQMAQALSGRSDVDAIHIISHGDEGVLLLGDAPLHAGNMERYSGMLAEMGRSLTESGDIHLWGCEVGAGDKGQGFLNALANATGADIAASSNSTGSAQGGGDWELEITTGAVAMSNAIDTARLETYDYQLATFSVSSIAELRAALAASAANGQTDIITFTGNITAASSSDMRASLTDGHKTFVDVNITDGHKLDIVGGGYSLDANYYGRVLEVRSGTVELSNLTIREGLISGDGGSYNNLNGEDALGAGIKATGGILNLSGVAITGHRATGGGGNGGGYGYGYGGGGGGGFAGIGGGDGGAYGPGYTGSAGGGGAGGTGGNVGASAFAGQGGTSIGGAGGTGGPGWGFSSGGTGGTAGIDATIGGGGAGAGASLAIAVGRGGNAVGALHIAGGAIVNAANTTVANNYAAGGGGAGSGMYTNGANGGFGVGGIYVAAGGVLNYAAASVDLIGTDNANYGAGGGGGANENGMAPGNAGDGYNTGGENLSGPGTITSNYNPNTAPTATNLTQLVGGGATDGLGRTALGDIVVTDPDSDEVITATLTMNNPAAGSLTTGTYGAATSTYSSETGVWSVTGSVADVNAALAAVAFVKAGNWSGDVAISTQVRDAAGAGPATGLITLDLTPPAAPSTPDLIAGSDSGSSPTDNLTNDTTPTFTGTAEANSTVVLYDTNGDYIGDGKADQAGNWSITTRSLSEGTHLVMARAMDEAGNMGAVSSATVITIDTTGPVVSPPNMQAESDSGSSNTDNLTNVVRPGFSGTAEAGAIIQLFIDNAGNGDPSDPLNRHLGNAVANQSGEWTITPTSDLPEGTWTIKARGRDAAGNFGIASPGLTVTIDTTPPAAPSTPDLNAASDTGVSNTDNITNDTTPTFTGTAGAGSTVELFNDANGNGVVDAGESLGTATADGAGVWSITATLGNGVHFIKAATRDAAGNASASSGIVVEIDATAPAAPSVPDLAAGSDTGLSDTDNLTNDATPTFRGTAEAYAQLEIYAGATLIGTTTAAPDGSWQITMPIALGDGTYNITARAIDDAGNVSAQSAPLAITIDTTAPVLDTASSTPAGNAVGVDPDSDIVLRFDELAIMPASGGFITLYNVTDGTVFETIAFASPAINGWGTDTIVISPSASLPPGKTIAVHWDGTVFSDSAGNVAAANTSDSFYAFTVRAHPVLTGGGTVSWTEGGAPVVVAPGLSVTDIDSANVAGATVQISDVRVGDTLALGVPGPFTASYDAATGLLTLSGIGTVAEMQAALRSITYSSSSDAPSGGGATPTRAITFSVFDESSGAASNSVTTAVTVVDVNDAPVLADTDLTLDPVVEDGGAPVNGVASGTLVSELVGGITDADLTLPRGIAIVGADASHGTWWFTTNGGASWSALGTPAEAAARLLAADANTRLHFAPHANWNGVLPAALTIRAWDMSAGSNGGMANISAIGTGGTLPFSTATDTVSLSVEAVNDAPFIAAPLQIGVVEDVTTPLTGISFTDVDAGSAPVTVTLSVGSGTLAATSGSGVVVGGTGQSLTLTGSVADLNAYLAGGNATYTTPRDVTASQTLTVSISDNGNTGSGGALTDQTTVQLNVTAVNDAPVITAPASISVVEDMTSPLTGITISDVDAGSGMMTVTLSVPAGALSAISGSGVVVGGTASALTLAGTVANLNAYLASGNVSYTPAANETVTRVLTVSVTDNGNSGSGGAQTDSTTVALAIAAVNDAPTITAPAQIGVTEDVASPLTGISIADVDAGSGAVTVTLSVPAGSLLATSGGGVVVAGTGQSLTLTGSVADLNAYLAGGNATYITARDSTASQILTVVVNDNGNTGAGGALTDHTAVQLNVTAVNDAPVITPGGGTTIYTEGSAPAVLDGGLTLSDVDSPTLASATVAITGNFHAGQDLLAFVNDGATMGNITSNYNAATGVLTLTSAGGTATLAQWQAALRTVTYANSAAAPESTSRTVSIIVSDGAASSAASTRSVSVVTINDAPVLADTNLTLDPIAEDAGAPVAGVGSGTPVSELVGGISDADLTLARGIAIVGADTSHGTWWFTTDGGASWSALGTPGEGTARLLAADANTRLHFEPNANWNGTLAAALTIRAWDLSAGSNGGMADITAAGTGGTSAFSAATDAVSLSVEAINDAPVVTAPVLIGVIEDVASPLTGIVIADVDAGNAPISVTLTVDSGTLAASSGAGVVVGGAGHSLTLTGSLADLNAYLASGSVTYTTARDSTVAQTLTVEVTDNGNTGAGGAKTDRTTIQLDATPVNDAPTADGLTRTVPFVEDAGPVGLGGIVIRDVDVGETVTATLTLSDPKAGVLSTGTFGSATARFDAMTGVWSVTGSVTDVNAALAALTFTPAANQDQSVQLAVSIRDSAGIGPDGALTLEAMPVNDAPTADGLTRTVPFVEDASPVGLGGIVVRDADVGETVTATLTLSDPKAGMLSTGTFGSATARFDAMTGVWSVSGSVADVNAALAALTFSPAANRDQSVQLAVSIRDSAGIGPDGVLTLEASPVNDAPVLTAPETITVTEDVASPLTGIVIADVDAGNAPISVTLTVSSGTLAASSGAGVVVGGAGQSLTLTGSLADLNAYLASGSVAYTTARDSTVAQTLTVEVTDNGNTGAGGAKIDQTTIQLDVTPVNDAPTADGLTRTVPFVEDAGPVGLGGIVIRDADAGETVTATLTLSDPKAGMLSIGTFGSATAHFDAMTGVWSVSGSVADVNAALAALTFTPAANRDQSVQLAVSIRDGSGTGPDGMLTLEATPVNDAPVLTAPEAISVTEDVASPLTGIVIADIDAGNAPISVTLTVSSGTLAASSGAGVVVGGTGQSLTLTGSLADLNAYLASGSVAYTTARDSTVAQTLTVEVTDNGNTGTGGAKTHQTTVQLDVTPVNDAPVSTGPLPDVIWRGGENSLALPGDAFADADAGDTLHYDAALADGTPLPSWLRFDAGSLTLSGRPPEGVGALTLVITATDQQGATAVVSFTLSYDNPAAPVPQPPAPPVHVPPAAAPAPPSEAPAPSSQVSGSGIGAPPAPILTVISGAPQGSLFGSPSDRDGRNALAPAWESEPRLSALQPVLDARVLGGPFVFALPLDLFLHRDPAAVLRLEARLADGSPLPDWLTFDPQTATFKGTPPPGAGTVTVEIMARDLNGQQTTATLKLQPGQAEAAAETPADAADTPADADRPAEGEARAASREGAETAEARLPGKPSFSQQLALARQGGLAAQHAALIEAAQAVARETRS